MHICKCIIIRSPLISFSFGVKMSHCTLSVFIDGYFHGQLINNIIIFINMCLKDRYQWERCKRVRGTFSTGCWHFQSWRIWNLEKRKRDPEYWKIKSWHSKRNVLKVSLVFSYLCFANIFSLLLSLLSYLVCETLDKYCHLTSYLLNVIKNSSFGI